jgi:hypothetical protein
MKTKDFSKEIYETYYDAKDKILEITLKDNTVLEGTFISFFHGDPDLGEPFVIRWHFIDTAEGLNNNNPFPMDEDGGFGRIIKQEDIKSIKFKS